MNDDYEHYRAAGDSWVDNSWDGKLDEVIFNDGEDQHAIFRELGVMCDLDWDCDGVQPLINSVTLVRVQIGRQWLNKSQLDGLFGIGSWRMVEAEAERAALRYHGQEG